MRRIINWFKSLPIDKKALTILVIGGGIYILTIIISGLVQKYQLSKHGVFYAAEIYEITSGKDGEIYSIQYKYRGVVYRGSFKPDFNFKPNRVGAYIFIKLLPNNPKIHQYLEKGEVTDSLLKVLPAQGWRYLPDVPRQYLLNGKYMRY
ncbi:MAG: hypothetical protein EOO06_19840 [Chitinophagaceae bacterium]|nr:MAG: hypothetical protein EOO06_19840 [Chitinophagaceae bacterium]